MNHIDDKKCFTKLFLEGLVLINFGEIKCIEASRIKIIGLYFNSWAKVGVFEIGVKVQAKSAPAKIEEKVRMDIGVVIRVSELALEVNG